MPIFAFWFYMTIFDWNSGTIDYRGLLHGVLAVIGSFWCVGRFFKFVSGLWQLGFAGWWPRVSIDSGSGRDASHWGEIVRTPTTFGPSAWLSPRELRFRFLRWIVGAGRQLHGGQAIAGAGDRFLRLLCVPPGFALGCLYGFFASLPRWDASLAEPKQVVGKAVVVLVAVVALLVIGFFYAIIQLIRGHVRLRELAPIRQNCLGGTWGLASICSTQDR